LGDAAIAPLVIEIIVERGRTTQNSIGAKIAARTGSVTPYAHLLSS
jgi:hypothetical protein